MLNYLKDLCARTVGRWLILPVKLVMKIFLRSSHGSIPMYALKEEHLEQGKHLLNDLEARCPMLYSELKNQRAEILIVGDTTDRGWGVWQRMMTVYVSTPAPTERDYWRLVKTIYVRNYVQSLPLLQKVEWASVNREANEYCRQLQTAEAETD
jgi:hypothetical protein